ncbi:uncharacterized protein LOC115882126 [Sitophilus oryzae]|uniref:Uncharacterized protein LOC115882126 n=1 Tax=Sitophilus oryzae TaxID=7048 RepID=A0A6J2XYT2_SITOR|nr:uncharacterized protein LOC115882126 [Sitophilus oryzae]
MEWQAVSGKMISVKQLSKKINNMKTKIKQKLDLSKTGNKPIKLKSWEQAFWKLMDGDRKPTLRKIPSAVQVGVMPPIETAVPVDIWSESSVLVPKPVKSMVSKKIKKHHLPETTETQNLLMAELQRLVLLEQLEVLRLKKKKIDESYNRKSQ